MQGYQLPQEMTDTIIDFLHDDAAALRSCSLTCRTWLVRSRHHLFSEIKLQGGTASIALFARLLSFAPHLAPYV
ncbi:hypothetical protein OBBRIDRAFT_730925, partial [Obba rivulosa]